MIVFSVYPVFFFFQAEDGIRDGHVTGVQTCALPILRAAILAGAALEIGGKAEGGNGLALALETLADGRAWKKFEAICEAQGGMRIPPEAIHVHPPEASHAGRVVQTNNRTLSRPAQLAGAPDAIAPGPR